jgi:hypothetical protein
MALVFSAAFAFPMTWMWFTTWTGTASFACAGGDSFLAVFQWPANIVLQNDTSGLVFHPIQKSL